MEYYQNNTPQICRLDGEPGREPANGAGRKDMKMFSVLMAGVIMTVLSMGINIFNGI
jgi:hypothetical protein